MKRRRNIARTSSGQIVDASEHLIQVRLLKLLVFTMRPEVLVFAIPNQAKRSVMNAMKMKAEGLRSGVSDLLFMFPDEKVAWLEMKKPGGTLRTEQKAFRAICARMRHRWAVASSLEEAWEILVGWDAIKKGAVLS
jgi:hypothetical protein